ncbi:MAG: hypothetical protein Q4D53_01930 [Leptotrichiaceae bacterium]|nr:hypothetical protein [Leptotrichiaceae bacterium]
MDKSSARLFEADEAYKKFLKSSKGFFRLKKRENLKSFAEVQKKENAYNSVYIGVKEVPLEKIVGSVEKYTDFDKNFVPVKDIIKQRWMSIYIGYVNESMLPPVTLYKIKDSYYVYDGNHRISVAKFMNFVSIEAEVEEFLPSRDDTDEIIYRESMLFEKETGIENVILTNPSKYKYLRNEIGNYMNFIHKRRNKETDYKKAAENWNRNIFIPVKTLIKKNSILENFNGENINDIFLFTLDHKYFLSKDRGKNTGYLFSTIDFINMVKTNENNGLNYKCLIDGEEMRECCRKLKKIDDELVHSQEETVINERLHELTGINFNYNKFLIEDVKKCGTPEKWYESKYRKIVGYFINKVNMLPQKYSDCLEYFKVSRIFDFILEYENIKNGNICEISEMSVLNYIIEVFLPIISLLEKRNDEWESLKNKFLNIYEKIQNEFFYIFKIEKYLLQEGKSVKYENIISGELPSSLFFPNENRYYNIRKILIRRKYNEFLTNLKKPEEFLKIYMKYGKTGEYETFVKLFEMLDILGEKEFLRKLKADLKKMSVSQRIVTNYKTKSVFYRLNSILSEKYESIFSDDSKYSFTDFYTDILFFTKNSIKDENGNAMENVDMDVDILDMELYYQENGNIRN